MTNKPTNPLLGKGKGNRTLNLQEQLTAPAIQNHSPHYQQTLPQVPMQNQLIVVTLDKLRPYEGNPRKTKNPAFDEIKASIRARGLDHPPNITQRPGDDYYIILDGGNTRLQALYELFKETQDLRFWSIECVFKPWQGDAEDINSKLNLLIGHLAENDVRGDLTFIEKALGIREAKALYEQKYNEYFSHRKLAETLGEQGYPISFQLIARMEQCLTYLYPHIPNVLLNGLGKPQIEKVLSIRNNALSAWDKYSEQYQVNTGFDDIWMQVLTPFDEAPEGFVISDVQDVLIGKMTEGLDCQVSYDALKLEIDLEERRLQRLLAKQPEIAQRVEESTQHLQAHQEKAQQKQRSEQTPAEKSNQDTTVQVADIKNIMPEQVEESDLGTTYVSEVNGGDEDQSAERALIGEDNLTAAVTQHLAGLGFEAGVNPETTRAQEAMANDLTFANTGRQPVTNIWKIHPNRRHKMDAFSLALDIAQECGLAHLVKHVVYEPVDYSFTMLPLDVIPATPLVNTIYTLLQMLSTDQLESQQTEYMTSLSTAMLLGSTHQSAEISDLMLVRIFRLIRLVRYLKQQSGEYDA